MPHPYRHGFSLKDFLRLSSVQSKRWLVPPAQRRGSTDLDAPYPQLDNSLLMTASLLLGLSVGLGQRVPTPKYGVVWERRHP